MEKRGFRPAVKPLLSVFLLALISYLIYYGSRRMANQPVQQALAAVFGTTYFLAIFFGALYIYTCAYLRGVRLPGRILASILVPFLWITKDVILLTESHPFVECLYWYFNPLSVWMVCLLAIEMGAGTLIARYILKRRGEPIKVFSVAPVASIVIGALAFGGIFAWGQGENLYVIFLDGYRLLFGSGV
jgi:uncharacterized membrane protein YjjP (DUF1212 family)